MQHNRNGVISMLATDNQCNKKNDDACQLLINLLWSAACAKASMNKLFFINILIHESNDDNENQLLHAPSNSRMVLV